ncbi:MAG TPA: hypothetical protein VMM93_03540, partial [Vicinamibacterales bacterium]|nr:hypothetical protein [Vicinamibacterales bacterium]
CRSGRASGARRREAGDGQQARDEDELQAMHLSRYANTLELMGATADRLAGDTPSSALLADSPTVRGEIEEVWRADAAETRLFLAAVEQRARAATARHERLFAWLAAPNPAMVFARALGAVADTGAYAEARWRNALDAYQSTLEDQHFDDPPRLTLRVQSDDAFQRILFDRKRVPRAADLPQFHPPVRDLGGRLYDARRDLALLAAFVLVTGLLAVACFPTSGT